MSVEKTSLGAAFPKNIVIVGCGGTGSRVADLLRFIISTAYAKGIFRASSHPKIWLVDHDVVEEKNCIRQPFSAMDVGELKCKALKDRLEDFLLIETVPEAINSQTLAQIFTEEIINDNFTVISCLDHEISASQLYFWLMDNVSSQKPDICWSYIYSGGEIRKGKIKGQFRKVDGEFSYPYVTTFLYGEYWGNPIVPVKPHQVNSVLQRPDPAIIGRISDGGGCGLTEETVGEQSPHQNNTAAFHVERMLGCLWLEGVVLNQVYSENAECHSALPASLDEILFPDEFPALAQFIQNGNKELPEELTVEKLKSSFDSFVAAKQHFGMAASSWETLVEKINSLDQAIKKFEAGDLAVEQEQDMEVLS